MRTTSTPDSEAETMSFGETVAELVADLSTEGLFDLGVQYMTLTLLGANTLILLTVFRAELAATSTLTPVMTILDLGLLSGLLAIALSLALTLVRNYLRRGYPEVFEQ
ncbi:hypothetical protein [Halomarina pelagica]|uniref:hypothetical protein n=1 Tax=Halomarina pelagica TaxID=2961599 RepID=UPI0020C45F06|nr:hypothetical protein [Halomarina sp. BND7]